MYVAIMKLRISLTEIPLLILLLSANPCSK